MADEIRALLDENRRLRREARLLRERVDAFERSRWWRLHPRRWLPRRRREASDVEPANTPTSLDDGDDDAVARRFRDEVVSPGSFTRDAFTHELPHLDPLVGRLARREAQILEVGSYEGMSSCYFLWRLPDARLTCVDTFRGTLGSDHPEAEVLEATFDSNVALVDASRVRKIVGDSRRVLLDLLDEDERYNLVYVDGSHFGLDVVVDGALSWGLLATGGTIVFDDYAWNDRGDDPLLRPGPGVDALLALLAGKYELLVMGTQVAVRKL